MHSLRVKVGAGNFLLALLIGLLVAACGEEEKKPINRDIYLYQGSEPITQAFEKKYSIKVVSWRALPEKVVQRALIETKAERYQFDVLGISGPGRESAYQEKLLEQFYS